MGRFNYFWKTAGLLILLVNPSFLFAQFIFTDIINDEINWELRCIQTNWTRGTTDILDPDATPFLGSVPEHEPSFLISAAASTNVVPDQVNAGNVCIQWNGVPTTTNSDLNTLIKTQLNTSYAGIDVDYRSWEDDAGTRCSLDSGDDDFMRIQKYYSLGIDIPLGGIWTLAPESFGNGSSSTVRYYWHYANGNTLNNPLNFGTIGSSVVHVNTNAAAPGGLSNAANFQYTSQYSGPNNQSSADVVYQFTINEARSITVSTNNPTTNFDTYIHLLDASDNPIASNNNASGTNRSTIQGELLCSGTYKVVVEGNGSATGTFRLNITLGLVPPFNGGAISEPANTVMQQGQTLPALQNSALPATAADVSYKWELSQDGGAWTTIPNAVGSSLNPGTFTGCSMSFRRKAYFCTEAIFAYSNTVTFTQNTDLSGGTIASEGSLFACTNGKLPNIVSVTPAELDFATYRWQYHFGGAWQPLNGQTGLNLTTGSLPGSTSIYYRRVATICGRDYPSNVITFSKYLSTDTDGPIYVKRNASGSNNGSSWTNAYTQLQNAIDEAECTGAPIWVAQGTYRPTVGVTGSDLGRDNTFFITEDIEIYGGFSGNETTLSQRDYSSNPTILSGDLGQDDFSGLSQGALITDARRQNNARHVMIMSQVSSNCILDGLEFTGGNFNYGADNIGGGAIYIQGSTLEATPSIRNCSFYNNSSFEFGGAVFNQSVNSNASPTFTNCTFDNNWASIAGGAVANQANKLDGTGISSPTFEYCRFTGNGAATKGGAIYNDPVNANSISSPIISSCEFIDNSAGEQGGAVHNFGSLGESTPRIVNSIFVDNTGGFRGGAIYNLVSTLNGNTEITNCSFYNNTVSVQGGAIYNFSAAGNSATSLLITNTILWNNGAQAQIPLHNSGFGKTILNYSIFDDGTIDNGAPVLSSRITGSNNLDSDPLFVSPTSGNLRLQGSSPAINAGNSSASGLSGVIEDLAGQDRIVGSAVDMGAYENACELLGTTIFVDIDAPAGGNGQSWGTAFQDLQDGIDLACSCDKPVWVAAGTYYPTREITYPNDEPSSIDGRKTFYINKNIQLYGGFAGTETELTERDFEQQETVLNGSFGSRNALRVVYIDGTKGTAITNECIIDGVSITGGGDLSSIGGGIFMDAGSANSICSPSIRNCKLLNNYAEVLGGAIGIKVADGGESSPQISNCIFENNTADEGKGGAIGIVSTNNGSAFPQISDCRFIRNRSQTEGGAIYIPQNTSGNEVVITNCDFEGNGSYNATGGAIAIYGAKVSINKCSFDQNQAPDGGGALYFERKGDQDVVLIDCIFLNNLSPFGGAIGTFGDLGSGTFECINCLFSENQAGNGGAFYMNHQYNNYAPLFTNGTFYNNSAGQGGAIYNLVEHADGNNLTLSNCILWNNGDEIYNQTEASTILNFSIIDDGTPDGNLTLPTGVSGTNNLDSDPLFVDTQNGDFQLLGASPAIDMGDDTAIPAGVITDLAGNDRVIGSSVDMGAYESTCATPTPAIFVDIDAPAGGDGQSWATAFRDLQDGIDQARNCGKPVWVAEGTYYPTRIFNGILSAGASDNYIKTFYIDRNIQLYGGFAGTETSLEERDFEQYVTILDGNFDATNVDALKVMYIDGSTGISITNACVIDGFSITGGNAQQTLGFDDSGGGIKLDGNGTNSVCSPSILNCRFFNNRANRYGGALFIDGSNGESSPRISNCTFDDNEAFSGYGGAITVLGKSALQLFDCTFTNNIALIDGGAIMAYGGEGDITFDGCTFDNNQSGQFGGAIYLEKRSNGDPLIRNSIFSSNEAESGGGAVFYGAFSAGGNPQFTNCLYYQNTTNGVGGAIYLETSSSLSQPSFTQCTFYDNTSSATGGGAIYSYADLVGTDNITFLNNCILWSNQDEILNDEGASLILNYSTIDDGSPNGTVDLPTGVSGTNNLDSDPLFVDAATGDLRLQLGSPAINTGNNALIPVGVSTDLDGNKRVVGIVVDMGAYENTTPLAPLECATILDFEAPNTTTAFQYFANDNLSEQPTPIIANPAPDATNASGTVLAFTKAAAGQTFAGAFPNPDPSRSLDFTDADQLCVKVLMDHPGNITLKVEDSTTDGPDWIQTAENTVVNEWVELCFDVSTNSLEAPFEAAVGNSYRRVTLFPDFGIPGTGVDVTTYFDDIKVCNSGDGLCGDDNLQLGGGDLTSGTYRGEITLTSANTIVSGPVVFTAGQSITLEAGFRAGPNVEFHAKIEDCLPAPDPNILEELEVPDERRLLSGQLELSVYPNPSSYETNIAFHLSESGRTSLEVYHSTGTLLQSLLDNQLMEAGEYTRQLQITTFEPGMYLVVLRSAGSTLVKKVMVIK